MEKLGEQHPTVNHSQRALFFFFKREKENVEAWIIYEDMAIQPSFLHQK